MKNVLKRVVMVVMVLTMVISMTACGGVTETPAVNFGFKNVDSAADYNESLTSFEVGKRFYTCVKIQLITDKKAAKDYTVKIAVPKTNEVEVKGMGGLEPDTIEWDEENQQTIMEFTIQGYKEATAEKILFYGTPTGEGEAKITVDIYDEDGEEINAGYSRTVFFVYELQQ